MNKKLINWFKINTDNVIIKTINHDCYTLEYNLFDSVKENQIISIEIVNCKKELPNFDFIPNLKTLVINRYEPNTFILEKSTNITNLTIWIGNIKTIHIQSDKLETLNIHYNENLDLKKSIINCRNLRSCFMIKNNLNFFSIIAPKLSSLNLGQNKLVNIKLNDYPYLTSLDIQYNQITSLNIKNNLISYIDISHNPIKFLDFKTTKNIYQIFANQNLEFFHKNNGFELLDRFGLNPLLIQKSDLAKRLF